MRETKSTLTPELESHCGGLSVWKAPAFEISRFRELVEHVARLSYANPDNLLFFRGQDKDYQSKAGGTTLYPAIYRGDSLANRELRHRFEILDQAARLLVDRFKIAKVEGHKELRYKRYIQWSILQHYEVVPTPLLDLTQSLRVACSFAQLRSTDPSCYVYVLGLPYLTNRISINSEHDIVNIRLLSICPPAALRPYFQEGSLAGTADVTSDFDSKTDVDFRNRLMAKFAIPRAKTFWGTGFDAIPESALYPDSDSIRELCDGLQNELRSELQPGHIGQFIKDWAALESILLDRGRNLTQRNVSAREAISTWLNEGLIDRDQAGTLDALRKFRNNLVHQPQTIEPGDTEEWLSKLRQVLKALPKTRP